MSRPFGMTSGWSVPTSWKAGGDYLDKEVVGEPVNVPRDVARRSYYAGREGMLEGYEGAFLFFVDAKTKQVHAQRRPRGECYAPCCRRGGRRKR